MCCLARSQKPRPQEQWTITTLQKHTQSRKRRKMSHRSACNYAGGGMQARTRNRQTYPCALLWLQFSLLFNCVCNVCGQQCNARFRSEWAAAKAASACHACHQRRKWRCLPGSLAAFTVADDNRCTTKLSSPSMCTPSETVSRHPSHLPAFHWPKQYLLRQWFPRTQLLIGCADIPECSSLPKPSTMSESHWLKFLMSSRGFPLCQNL